MNSVPDRKTDVVDCPWLQELHRAGLLATHVQRMQKALVEMNLQLPR